MSKDPAVQFIKVNDIQLAYRECGNPAQPTLVLLHGLAETSAFFWRPLIKHFQQDYHIIAFDLLGHGDSDKPSSGYEIENQAHLIDAALQHLHLNQVIFVGHSLGGLIAARLCLQSPQRASKLVLYDSPLSDSPRKNLTIFLRSVPFTALMLVASVIFPKSVARLALGMVPLRLGTRLMLRRWRVPYNSHHLDNEFLDHAVRNSSLALMECARSAYMSHNIVRDLSRLDLPTCMIVGDTDLLLPVHVAKRLVRLFPKGKLVIIKDASHVALIDQPEAFNKALRNFLTES